MELNEKPDDDNDQIIMKETFKSETSGVKTFYLKNAGGFWPMFLLGLVMTLWITLNTGTNYWIKYWVGLAWPVRREHDEYWYLKIYIALSCSYSFLEAVRVFLINWNN